jgi:hypothetical protein
MDWETYEATIDDVPGRTISTVCGEVERRKIPELFNETYWSALRLYNRFKFHAGRNMFGGLGWAELPAHITWIIDAFDDASKAVTKEWQSRKS